MDQVILRICGSGGDATIVEAGHALNDRAKRHGKQSAIVALPPNPTKAPRDGGAHLTKCVNEMRRVLPSLGPQSRLYVIGHGNWRLQTMSGWHGDEIGEMLVGWGGLRQVGKISVTGCFMGGHGADRTAVLVQTQNTTRTFAGLLHWYLGVEKKVETVVNARTEATAVISESVLEDPDDERLGRKLIDTYTRDDVETQLKYQLPTGRAALGAKIRFEWVDGRSVCTTV